MFDRLGGKNKSQSSSSTSNPGKSILKLSSSSLRITKGSPTTLLATKRGMGKSRSLQRFKKKVNNVNDYLNQHIILSICCFNFNEVSMTIVRRA